MKPCDIVRCKTLWRPSGVMGSSLKEHKKFHGLGIVLDTKKHYVKVMLFNSKILKIKERYLEVVIENRKSCKEN